VRDEEKRLKKNQEVGRRGKGGRRESSYGTDEKKKKIQSKNTEGPSWAKQS